MTSITNEIANSTNPGPPVFTGTPAMDPEQPVIAASAPPKDALREIVIRSQ